MELILTARVVSTLLMLTVLIWNLIGELKDKVKANTNSLTMEIFFPFTSGIMRELDLDFFIYKQT